MFRFIHFVYIVVLACFPFTFVWGNVVSFSGCDTTLTAPVIRVLDSTTNSHLAVDTLTESLHIQPRDSTLIDPTDLDTVVAPTPDTLYALESGIFAFYPVRDTATRLIRWDFNTSSMQAQTQVVDTSFGQAHRFIPEMQALIPQQTLGISCGPSQSVDYFARSNPNTALCFAQTAMSPYLSHQHTLYSTRRPFSLFEVTYNFRTNKAELVSSWFFTQNINPYWNLAIELYHGDETVSIESLNTRVNGGQLSLWHAKDRLLSSLSLGYRKAAIIDNGGILHPTWLTDTVLKHDVLPIRQKGLQLRDRNIDARFHLEYALLRHNYTWQDSVQENVEQYQLREPALSLFTWHSFMNPTHTYENPAINDSLEVMFHMPEKLFSQKFTHDSLNIMVYETKLGVTYRPSRAPRIRWLPLLSGWVGYTFQRCAAPHPHLYLQGYQPKWGHSLFVGGAMQAPWDPVYLTASFHVFPYGARRGDTKVQAALTYHPLKERKKMYLKASFFWNSRPLHPFMGNFTSNEYVWTTPKPVPFLHIIEGSFALHAPWWGGSYGIKSRLYRNYLYFNQEGLPQRSSIQNVNQLFIQQDFYRWGVTLTLRTILQKATDETTLHLPLFAGYGLLGYEYELVKNALTARLAVEAYYTTAYQADVFNAAIGAFHLQDEFTVGNYPYCNALLNLKWKTVNVYVCVSHVTQGLFGRAQFASPLYPLRKRAVRFGLEWNFQ